MESVDALIDACLRGNREDAGAWDAVKKLHALGTREVLQRSVALTLSADPLVRARGADILGQLGVQPGIHSRAFLDERLQALTYMLQRESDPDVLDAVIIALGHLGEPDGIRRVSPYSDHQNENVRYAVAWTLGGMATQEPDIIETLMKLMKDSDSDVRDWATFGLGSQSDADSEVIRDALFERVEDDDEDTRAEAVVGLAKRMDLRALPVVLEELERDEYGTLYEEAASFLLGNDGDTPDDWEGWKYVEELQAKFNIAVIQDNQPIQ